MGINGAGFKIIRDELRKTKMGEGGVDVGSISLFEFLHLDARTFS